MDPDKKMTLRKFGRLVREAMEALPEDFEPYLENVVVDIARRPDEAQLRSAGLSDEEIADGETILGLFEPDVVPTDSPFVAADDGNALHRIWVFRDPHLEEFPDPAELRRQIRKTVIHEVAHHFGLTDRDLERWTTVY